MNAKLTQVASFANAVEADQAKLVLESAGIVAFVDGAEVGTTLWHVGSALQGVRVLVSDADAQRALEVLDQASEPAEVSAEAWFCGKCSEEVDAGFAVCWSCGETREAVGQPFPSGTEVSVGVETDSRDARVAELATVERTEEEASNPYASPMVESKEPAEPVVVDPVAEEIVLRAWRAAIIGAVTIPVFINAYSMYLLCRATLITEQFSGAATRRYYMALALNLVALGAWIAIFTGISTVYWKATLM